MDIDEKEHPGCVKSRTHETFLVGEPVVVVIDGRETELSLQDAKWLLCGLQEAIARVEESESKLKADSNGHLVVIGKTRSGMSVLSTKLGASGFIYLGFARLNRTV